MLLPRRLRAAKPVESLVDPFLDQQRYSLLLISWTHMSGVIDTGNREVPKRLGFSAFVAGPIFVNPRPHAASLEFEWNMS